MNISSAHNSSAHKFRLQTLILALLLALFGVSAVAQDGAQDSAQQDAEQQETTASSEEMATGEAVIQLGPNESITESEFETEFSRATRALARRQGLPYNEETKALFDRFREDFLNQLATRHALLREAEARGIEVTDEEVEQQIAQAREGLGGEEQFQQALQDLGFESVETYRESVREGLLTQRVIDDLSAGVEITDQEIETFYDENQELFSGAPLDDQVREQVRGELVNERLTQQFADLQAQYGIETFPERVIVDTGAEEGVAGGGAAAEGSEASGGEAETDAEADGVETDDAETGQDESSSGADEGEDEGVDEVPAVEDVEEQED